MSEIDITMLRASFLLKRLEQIPHDRYVIHGSSRFHKLLRAEKPNLKNRRLRKFSIGGVYATRYIEIATLYALSVQEPWWRMNRANKFLQVLVPDGTEFCVNKVGYVHILSAENFTRGVRVVRSERGIQAQAFIKVDYHFLEFLERRKLIRFAKK